MTFVFKRTFLYCLVITSLSGFGQNPTCTFARDLAGASNDQGRNICMDASGNAIVVGRFAGTVDFDPSGSTANLTSSGGDDAFVAKYTSGGLYVWAIKIGSAGNETAEGVSVDAAGNVYVSGGFFNTIDFDPGVGTANLASAGNDDIFVAKYTSSGLYTWAIKIGGTGSDVSRACAYDATGNVYVTGRLGSANADFDPGAGTSLLSTAGNDDVFLAKYSSAAGAYQWAIKMGAANNDSGEGVSTDGAGVAFVTGFFQSTADFDPSGTTNNLVSAGNDDIFVASYSSAGAYAWAFRIGSANDDQGRNVVYSSIGTGALAVTGFFTGTNVDFDPSGSTANRSSNGSDDAFVAKYTPAGSYFWAFGFGSAGGAERGEGIAIDAAGNVYVAGRLNGTADFDPSAGTANISNSGGGEDMYVAEYSSNGSYQFAFRVGGANTDRAAGVAVGGASDMVITGVFAASANVDFDATAATVNINTGSNSNDDVFVAKYATSAFLPITLTEFSALKKNSGIELNWVTASELNNDYFTIEKSMDGVNFETVNQVKGAGNSTTYRRYSDFDQKPYKGLSYYRLKQTDFDGNFEYSDFVMVQVSETEEVNLNIFPNPADEHISVQFKGLKNQFISIRVNDEYGREQLFMNTSVSDSEENILALDISSLSKGMYVLNLFSVEGVYRQKLIVK